jgi:membrane protease YdiL (CAAX protease family)
MTPPPGDAAPLLAPVSLAFLAVGLCCAVFVFALRGRLLNRAALSERARLAATIPPVLWLAAGFSGWLVWVFAMAFTMAALPKEPLPSLPTTALASVPAYALGVATVVIALWAFRSSPAVRACRVSPPDLKDGGIALLLGIPMVLAIGVLSFLAATLVARTSGATEPSEIAHGTLREILTLRESSGLSWWILPVAIQVVVLAPLLEEVLYRGCLQAAFVSATGRSWPSILAASAIFALVHASAVPWHAMPTLFAVGAICGVTFERTGRLGPAILFHAAFNALNLGIALASAAPAPSVGG